MTDDPERLTREWAMIAEIGDPLSAAVLAATSPRDAYRAATAYGPFLDDPDLSHAGGLYTAWAELTDLFETGKTDTVHAAEILREAARRWLARPSDPSDAWVEDWIAWARNALATRFRADGDFWRDPA